MKTADSATMATQLADAVSAGDAATVQTLLAQRPELSLATVADNPRSMLHYATDWPGHRPNVGRIIELLIAAGADPQATIPGDSDDVAETPLHWAASVDDVEAIDALLAGGAEVDPLGGIFGGCTPFEEAIIFEKYTAAARLLEHGATWYLPGAAALNRMDLVAVCFDANGQPLPDVGNLPHWRQRPEEQVILDRAFQFACRAGHLEAARYLHERGADPKSLTPVGTSALDEADKNQHRHVIDWLSTLD